MTRFFKFTGTETREPVMSKLQLGLITDQPIREMDSKMRKITAHAPEKTSQTSGSRASLSVRESSW